MEKKHEKWKCYYTIPTCENFDSKVFFSRGKRLAFYNNYNNSIVVFGKLDRTAKRHLTWFVSEIRVAYGKEPTVRQLSIEDRDRLFKIKQEDFIGENYSSFYDLSLHRFIKALEKGYFDPRGTQNGSPTTLQFLDFALQNQTLGEFTFDGYLIYPPRKDYRATIEAVEVNTTNEELQEKFKEFAKTAGEIKIKEKKGYCYAWWD